jgi:hypothetical protein
MIFGHANPFLVHEFPFAEDNARTPVPGMFAYPERTIGMKNQSPAPRRSCRFA